MVTLAAPLCADPRLTSVTFGVSMRVLTARWFDDAHTLSPVRCASNRPSAPTPQDEYPIAGWGWPYQAVALA
jgi:hypothetical protein